MPLVEVIGRENLRRHNRRCGALCTQNGKNTGCGGRLSGILYQRVLFPYLNAFSLLVSGGADIKTVDRVMEQEFGWPMGPALLLDVVGLDTANHVQHVMAEGYRGGWSLKSAMSSVCLPD